MKEIIVGRVADYFAKIDVVAIEVRENGIKIGDSLHFKGHTTDFIQKINSMQIEREDVEKADIGANVGIKANDRVRKHDKVYKIVED
ncbi:hypothetical protein ES705_29115 [subsurface metagenome]